MRLCQVFKDADRLSKFLMLRMDYVLTIVADSLKIDKFALHCNGIVEKSKLAATIGALKGEAADGQAEVRREQLVFFDLAQSVSTWPQAWCELLMRPPGALYELVLEKVPVLKSMTFDERCIMGSKLRSYLPAMCLGTDDAGAVEDSEAQEKQKTAEQKEGQADADAANLPSSFLSLESIHRFYENSDSSSMMMDESMDAFALKIDELDTAFLCLIQHKLQFLLTAIYSRQLRENVAARSISIDLAKKASDAVVITKNIALMDGFEMMMSGTVSMTPYGTLGKDHYPLCSLFGIQYYVNAPKDIFATDCVVPGWCTKIVSRNDLAYFTISKREVSVILYMSGGEHGLQMQFSEDVAQQFRSILVLEKSFADRSDEEQLKLIKQSTSALMTVAGTEVKFSEVSNKTLKLNPKPEALNPKS